MHPAHSVTVSQETKGHSYWTFNGMPSSIGKMLSEFPCFSSLVLVPAGLIHLLLSIGIGSVPSILHPDKIDSSEGFLHSLTLKSILFLISSGLITFLYLILKGVLNGVSLIWSYVLHQNMLRTTEVPLDHLFRSKVTVPKKMLVWSAVLAAVAVVISSPLAIVLTVVFNIVKLISKYTRCQFEEERRGPSKATCHWYFHFILLFLWLCVLVLASPGLITWFKNLKFSLKLSTDVYVLPCTFMILFSAVLWQLPAPVICRYKYRSTAVIIQILGILTTMYAILSIYRLLYIITVVFALVCIHQIFAYFHGPVYTKFD